MIEINDKKSCCGCEACRQICVRACITMQPDEEGFLYPEINTDLCVDCGLCTKVCPILDNNRLGNETLNVYAAKNRNKEIQFKSASGGAFSPFVEYVLSKGGVIFGACYNDKFEVIHSEAQTEQESIKFRSSKYVQSRIGDTYMRVRELLRQDRYVLFSGTPCQVAGLRTFLANDYEKLYCVDILCHSVPSPLIFEDYIKHLQKKGELSKLNMRSKDNGNWIQYSFRYQYINGKTQIEPMLHNLWMKLFLGRLISRTSCHNCIYINFKRQGDVTIGDFWGIEKRYPTFYDDNGVSLLLVNSQKGEHLLSVVKNSFSLLESDREECMQPILREPFKPTTKRAEFWRDYLEKDFSVIVEKYGEIGLRYSFIRFGKRIVNKLIITAKKMLIR